MKLLRLAVLLALTSMVAACGAPSDHDTSALAPEFGDVDQTIVNGQIDNGHPQVMALWIFPTMAPPVLCSGTLFHKRAIVTAAHCLEGEIAQIYAYHGNNFNGDVVPQIFLNPPPGVPGHVPPHNFRNAVYWAQHPKWDPATVANDVGFVYLEDRDLPFEPMRLGFSSVRKRNIGDTVTIVGYGSEASDPSNAGGPGAFIKRSGSTVYEGFPETNPLPPNPHPGITNRRINRTLMQLDGMAPNSNMCFGDSGGPAIMKIGGKDRVVGIASWTGDFCEDFSYYVRVRRYIGFLYREVYRQNLAERGEEDDGDDGDERD